MAEQLEQLYQEARSALKARDYVRAGELLRQILQIDENYKDASRLLAQTVKLRRRRWYNHPLLWSTLGAALIIVVGFVIAPQFENLPVTQAPVSSPATIQPTGTLPPIDAPVSTNTVVPTPTAFPLTWKRISIGQEFERDTVTVFIIHPHDPDVLYAGMKNAGIFKSIDGGSSWQPAHHGLSNAHVTSLWIDSQNPDILYAGTMGGIYKSEDGGETWSTIGSQNFLLMDPQDSSHLYARDENGIYESTDQGRRWKSVYALEGGCPDKIHLWAIDPVNGGILIADGGEECEPGLYQSNDGGHAWTLIEKRELCPDGIGLSIGLDQKGNYIYQEICPENGWNEFRPFATSDWTYIFWGSRLYKHNSNEEKDLILGNPDVGVPTSITESLGDPNTIYVTGKGLSVSKDGGLTWTKLNNGLGTTILQMQTDLDDAGTIYLLSGNCQENEIAGDKGWIPVQPLYVSTNNGITWNFSDQVGCYLIQDSAGTTLYRVGSPGRGWETGLIWRSPNNGKSWEKVLTPHQVIALTTSPSQSGFLYLHTPETSFSSTRFFFSEDYGNKWKSKSQLEIAKRCHGSTLQFIDAHRPMAIDPFDGDHVFVIENSVLLESHNSCDTTEAFATPPTAKVNSIAFDPGNQDTLYTGTDEGAYVSFDSGATWNQINDGLLGATVVYSIVVDKDSNVYAATPYGVFILESK